MTISSGGGRPRELPAWARMHAALNVDGRMDIRQSLRSQPDAETSRRRKRRRTGLVCVSGRRRGPGGHRSRRRATRGGTAAGLADSGYRRSVLFAAGSGQRSNAWEIRISPGSWRVQGVPRQLTFGTLSEEPASVSATGSMALEVGHGLTDFYLIPLSSTTGQPTAVARRLTQDGRYKNLAWVSGGNPGSAYFVVSAGTAQSVYALEPG